MTDSVSVTPGLGADIAMSKIGKVFRQQVESYVADSASIDAFGRMRVSEPVLLLDSKRVGGVPDVFMTEATSGTASTLYRQDRASTTLTAGPGVGTATRQTKVRAVYQPGKSLLVFQTFVCGVDGVGSTQEVGYFDDENGVFLRYSNGSPSFVIRSSVTGAPVETVIPQDDWSNDSFDGLGPSGINRLHQVADPCG